MTARQDAAPRDVDAFLADLDAVLAATPTSEAPAPTEQGTPTVPTPEESTAPELAPALPTVNESPAEPAEPDPESVPDLTQPTPTAPTALSPRPRTRTGRSGRLPDWRTGQTTDLTLPAKPEPEPEPTPIPADGAPADLTKPPTPEATEPDTDDDQDDEQTTPRTRKLWALLKADHEARAVTTPPKSQKARARARRTVYAVTAYGMGWTLHLPTAITSLLEVSADYAIPVSGGVLAAGIVGLATHTRGGGVVFLSSLGLITVMTMVPPAYFIGGALTLASLLAYRVVRGWLGQYAATWPWTGVAWAAFIPTATTAVTTLLHGTN